MKEGLNENARPSFDRLLAGKKQEGKINLHE